jgi:archaellum component FlaF (FlaF/FlaG flagellin family)
MLISMKKHAAMVNTNSATKSSSFLTYINVQNKGYMSVHMHEKFFYKW